MLVLTRYIIVMVGSDVDSTATTVTPFRIDKVHGGGGFFNCKPLCEYSSWTVERSGFVSLNRTVQACGTAVLTSVLTIHPGYVACKSEEGGAIFR